MDRNVVSSRHSLLVPGLHAKVITFETTLG